MQTGTLKKYFIDKGFGFIAPDNGQPDLFAHKRALQGADESQLREGLKVTYLAEMEDRTNKPKAGTWRLLDAGAAAPMMPMGAEAFLGGAIPDYSALAAASFGGIPGMADNRYSPYGTMPAGVAGMAMPGMMPGMAPALPLGWEQVADPATGKPYYCNRATGESSWTPPVAPVAALPPVVAPVPMPAPIAAAAPALPAGWESAPDPSTGNLYYFKRATGETTWTVPVA